MLTHTRCHMHDVSKAVETGVDGVMAARGLLENPALFSGAEWTPAACVSDWLRVSAETGTPFTCFHHHLIYMCGSVLPRAEMAALATNDTKPPSHRRHAGQIRVIRVKSVRFGCD